MAPPGAAGRATPGAAAAEAAEGGIEFRGLLSDTVASSDVLHRQMAPGEGASPKTSG